MADHSAVTPEQLEQLKALIDVVAAHSATETEWAKAIDVVGRFFRDAGWQLVAFIALLLFRGPISRLRSFTYKDVKLEIDQQIESAADQAARDNTGLPQGVPTADEVARSGEVETLARAVTPSEIRNTAIRIAAEYERVRADMSPGDARTRRMEIVVSKMRSFGRAAMPLRHELLASQSPGQRLMAIASLQVAPDYELLGWLVERISEEKPFVAYHAALALLIAAREPRANANFNELTNAKKQLHQVEGKLPADSDRAATLAEFKSLVEQMELAQQKNGTAASS